MGKHKHKHKPNRHRRNAPDGIPGIPDDVLLPLAPVQPTFLQPQPTQALMSYPPLSVGRAVPKRRWTGAVKKKAADAAKAAAPEFATLTKDHFFDVGANAAGGVATAVIANELVDNVGVFPMAIGATILGGFGSAFFKGRWQKLSQGVLGAGVGQLGTAYLTERALKKAAAAQKQAAAANQNQAAAPPQAPAAGKRNAYLGGDDDDTMLRAMERTERRVNALLADEDARNAYGDSGIDGDGYDYDAYGYVA